MIENKIREIRKSKGMTLEQVANACVPKTSGNQIRLLETGGTKLTVDWLAKLSKALECTPSDIVPKFGTPSTPTANEALELLTKAFANDETIKLTLELLEKQIKNK